MHPWRMKSRKDKEEILMKSNALRSAGGLASVGLTLVLSCGVANATVFSLEDLNSTMTVSPDADVNNDQVGVTSWVINNTNVMYEEWFWIRFDGDNQEYALTDYYDPMFDTGRTVDTDNNGFDESFNITYNVLDLLLVTIDLELTGSACCGSDLAETVSIKNISGGDLGFSFFEYTDFDIGGVLDDYAAYDEAGNVGVFTQNGDGYTTTTSVNKAPDRWQIDEYPVIRDMLTDGDVDNLTNSVSPYYGLADITWAAQWNLALGDDQTWILSKDKLVSPVPVPATALMLLTGVAGFGALRARRTV